jgi:hypothetical protein
LIEWIGVAAGLITLGEFIRRVVKDIRESDQHKKAWLCRSKISLMALILFSAVMAIVFKGSALPRDITGGWTRAFIQAACPDPSFAPTNPRDLDFDSAVAEVWWGSEERGCLGSDPHLISSPSALEAASGDFDGNEVSDVVWYSPDGLVTTWWGETENLFDRSALPISLSKGLTPVVGNFDGDEFDDVYWYGPAAPEEFWWGAPNRVWNRTDDYQNSTEWDQLVAGDFNGDEFDDIYLYRNSAKEIRCANTLEQSYWWGIADRSKLKSGLTKVPVESSKCYRKWFVSDFDGNEADDFIGYGQLAYEDDAVTFHWKFPRSGPEIRGLPLPFPRAPGFRPVLGDFDGDTRGDAYWFSPSGTDEQWWGSEVREELFKPHYGPQVSGDYYGISGDFDGDRKSDILWYRR